MFELGLHGLRGTILFGLARDHMIGSGLVDLFGHGRPGAHGIDGDGGSLQAQGIELAQVGFNPICSAQPPGQLSA